MRPARPKRGGTSQRAERMASVIQRELSTHLSQSHDFEGASVVGVRVSPDCRHAWVLVHEGLRHPLQSDAERKILASEIQRRAPLLRAHLGAALKSRYTPELHIEYDFGTQEAEKLISLIDSLKK